MNKNNRKHLEGILYEAPSAKPLEVLSEGLLCSSGDYNLGGGGIYGDDDIYDNGEY